MKEFKTKKRKKKAKNKLLLFVFLFMFSYVFVYKYVKENSLNKDILDKNNNYINYSISKEINNKVNNTINKPVRFLNNNIKFAKAPVDKKEEINDEKETVMKIDEPAYVYIYNTHDGETYIDYNVYDAAYKLSNDLNSSGIINTFETNSVGTFLQTNNLKYYKSYEGSRNFIDNAIKNNSNLKYFFDIHRDALPKDKSTLITDKSYAKVMFIVGGENKGYVDNLNNANKLSEIINNLCPGISRGVRKKEGKGVNGLYNQDVSPNSFLIEVGGNYNTKEEVINTLDVLKEAIIIYIRGVI